MKVYHAIHNIIPIINRKKVKITYLVQEWLKLDFQEAVYLFGRVLLYWHVLIFFFLVLELNVKHLVRGIAIQCDAIHFSDTVLFELVIITEKMSIQSTKKNFDRKSK